MSDLSDRDRAINVAIDDLANEYKKRFSSHYSPVTDLDQAIAAARALGYKTLPIEVVTAEGDMARLICEYLLKEHHKEID